MAPGRALISSLPWGSSLEPLLTQEAGFKVTRKVTLAVFSLAAAIWPAATSYLCLRPWQDFNGSLILFNRHRCGASGKEPACQCRRHRDFGLIPGSGRSPGGGNGNPLQYSCLGNLRDRGALWATVLRGAKSGTRLTE